MITIFNRKELLKTCDMKKQRDVRTILRHHKIEYDFKVKNISRPITRAYTGTHGIDLAKTYEHKIYVKKADYERALELIK